MVNWYPSHEDSDVIEQQKDAETIDSASGLLFWYSGASLGSLGPHLLHGVEGHVGCGDNKWNRYMPVSHR